MSEIRARLDRSPRLRAIRLVRRDPSVELRVTREGRGNERHPISAQELRSFAGVPALAAPRASEDEDPIRHGVRPRPS
jgi:hypothetical protein